MATTKATWSGVIGVEGKMTGDGRMIDKNALRWESLPLPMRNVLADNGGHDGAVVVATIDKISRGEGGNIIGEGTFDLGSEAGREAYRQVSEGITTGVSMDLDDVSFEVRVAGELLDAMQNDPDSEETGEIEVPDEDADGNVKVMEVHSDDEIMVTTDARIRAATIVAIPAFIEARITSSQSESDDEPDETDDELAAMIDEITASASLNRPNRDWFRDPEFVGPTPLTITADGHIYGHLALWGTCHVAHMEHGQCVQPPESHSDYRDFKLGSVLCEDGKEVSVGHITMDTIHASPRLSAAGTVSHYEDTGAVAAYVNVGEDSFGIWFAGSLAPRITPDQVSALRASPLSGDWRTRNGSLELVGCLAVNIPGFPVPRPSGMVASGKLLSLVASGMVPPSKVRRPGAEGALSLDDLRYLKRLAANERQREADAITASARLLVNRVYASSNEAKVRAFAESRS